MLFSGSIRGNLDPFNAHPDDDIWAALQHAHLSDFVKELPEQLSYECGEGGEALR